MCVSGLFLHFAIRKVFFKSILPLFSVLIKIRAKLKNKYHKSTVKPLGAYSILDAPEGAE